MGNKDPDAIPRNLGLLSGGFKKKYLNPEIQYVARNNRFKLNNVHPIKDCGIKNPTFIDIPIRRINLIDFLIKTNSNCIKYMHTDLAVDLYYKNDLISWIDRLEDFYAKTSIQK